MFVTSNALAVVVYGGVETSSNSEVSFQCHCIELTYLIHKVSIRASLMNRNESRSPLLLREVL